VRDLSPVATSTIPKIDPEEVAARLEQGTAVQAIEWMFETFGQSHYIACSFQKTSSVTAHLASQINPEARFFYLDTDVLFPETYKTRDELAEHLGVEFDRFHNLTLEEQAAQHGDELWKSDPDACCGLRKVEPMRRALSSVDCRRPPRGLGESRQDSQVRLGQAIRAVEAEPDRGLDRARRLELHP
jgi:3'-phosphoadenosine 5'-phosphosulfate sulfotransferase (PAPS reductase)/FAD synthetase